MKIKSEKEIKQKFLRNKYRRIMWKNYKDLIKKIEKIIPISSAYLVGSFISGKKRPADVDLLLLMKTKKNSKENWAIDLEIVPANKFGEEVLEDLKKWRKQKYKKQGGILRIK